MNRFRVQTEKIARSFLSVATELVMPTKTGNPAKTTATSLAETGFAMTARTLRLVLRIAKTSAETGFAMTAKPKNRVRVIAKK